MAAELEALLADEEMERGPAAAAAEEDEDADWYAAEEDADLLGCWEDRPEGACWRRAAKNVERKKGRWEGIVGCAAWAVGMGGLGWDGMGWVDREFLDRVLALRDFLVAKVPGVAAGDPAPSSEREEMNPTQCSFLPAPRATLPFFLATCVGWLG